MKHARRRRWDDAPSERQVLLGAVVLFLLGLALAARITYELVT